jgi:hypothetical protein
MGTGNRTSRKQHETDKSEPRAIPSTAQPGSRHGQVAGTPTITIDDEMHHRMVEEAAYFMAEHRGFCEGFELDDWLAAESEVNQKLESLHSH